MHPIIDYQFTFNTTGRGALFGTDQLSKNKLIDFLPSVQTLLTSPINLIQPFLTHIQQIVGFQLNSPIWTICAKQLFTYFL